MSLEIEKREREGIAILDLKGRITMGDEVSAFRKVVQELVASGSQKLILNLQHVDYIDSTGLGAVVMCSTAFRNAGGSSKLLNLNKRNVELLVTTKLATIFEAAEALQRKLEAFPWLTAVAVGELDGREVIFVYAKSLRHKEVDSLRHDGWMGYEVIVEKVGTIRPAHST